MGAEVDLTSMRTTRFLARPPTLHFLFFIHGGCRPFCWLVVLLHEVVKVVHTVRSKHEGTGVAFEQKGPYIGMIHPR